ILKAALHNRYSYFFHHPDFVFRNANTEIISFSVEGMSIYFTREGDCLISLSRSPFGGFVLSDQINVVAGLQQLIPKFLKWATDQGITSIVIRSMPEVYDPIGNKKITEILMQYGFSVRYHDTTQVLSVAHQPPRMADD